MRSLPIILSASLVVGAAAYGLNRGVFLGSSTWREGGMIHRSCRYLFVTGVSDLAAHGGTFGRLPAAIAYWGTEQLPPWEQAQEDNARAQSSKPNPFDQFDEPPKPTSLYCTLFAE